jgi:hypothetical protein
MVVGLWQLSRHPNAGPHRHPDASGMSECQEQPWGSFWLELGECQVQTYDLPDGSGLGMRVARADPRVSINAHLFAWLIANQELMAPWCKVTGDQVGDLIKLTPTEGPRVIYRLVEPLAGGWVLEFPD